LLMHLVYHFFLKISGLGYNQANDASVTLDPVDNSFIERTKSCLG